MVQFNNIDYKKHITEISKYKNTFYTGLFAFIILLIIIIYRYGSKNGWWDSESKKKYGVDLSEDSRNLCGKVLMECGIDEYNNRYRIFKWKI